MTEVERDLETPPQPPTATAPSASHFNSSLSSFYMSLQKTGMPAAAVTSANNPLSETVSEPGEKAAVTEPDRRATLEERLKKRIKAHFQAQKREDQPPPPTAPSFDATKLIEYPTARFSDLGALDSTIRDIREVVERPFRHPELYEHLGVDVPRGVLFYGPPGCGKTCLAMAVAGELGVPLFRVSAPEVVSGMSGESEAKIRELFEAAKRAAPALIFIDEIDAITPKRENAQREMERRIVAQLLTSMDDLSHGATQGHVMVLAATNRPDALDAALRRAGRFDREIKLGIPNETGREQILCTLGRRLRVSESVSWSELARKTPGYVGADLKALTREAAAAAVNRIFAVRDANPAVLMTDDADAETKNNDACRAPALTEEELQGLAIERDDFAVALTRVQPSATREGFAVVPNITWDDIGALSYVREELRMAIVEPIRHPALFAAVGLTAPAGVLLCGPPGCGKTLLAKAVANETHSNFISVKGPELLNKYVGESERAVRQVFERAAASMPCVIFFDEIDALCPRRAQDTSGDSSSSRIVNQLLTEMDGLEGRQQVYILAATNRPDILDPALTRPGRLDKTLHVRLPMAEERVDILRTCGRKTPWHPDVDFAAVAADPRAEGFSGADIAALVRESALAAIRLLISNHDSTAIKQLPVSHPLTVTMEHIALAFDKVKRSVSRADELLYDKRRLQ